MISEIHIQNFKSITDLKLNLGRVTVLIGENGSGKSNILEAITFAAGAAANKLDNSFLFNRGIRVTDDTWMTCAFPVEAQAQEVEKAPRKIKIQVKGSAHEPVFKCLVTAMRRQEDNSFHKWDVSVPLNKLEVEEALLTAEFKKTVRENMKRAFKGGKIIGKERDQLEKWLTPVFAKLELSIKEGMKLGEVATALGLEEFMIYAPENTTLRTPPPESAVQPMGSKGEGLLKLLQSFSEPKFKDRLDDMKKRLRLFGWFEDFLAPDDAATDAARLQIRDKWLAEPHSTFDQRSANEGFLYLLFYFSVLMSWRTPRFFAFDNIDNALNPKLCSVLMRQMVELAERYGKQIICTTHNPAILDGLNLNDESQRLYTVQRDSDGHTMVNRVHPPKAPPGKMPMKLSSAFLAGHIGGLPEHF